MDPRVERILTKLEQVRQLAPKTFGGDTHRFVLGAPIDEDSVRAFEVEHGVTLPSDFRMFITQAGASGAGPYYGLLPMRSWGSALYGDEKVPDWLARPFLFAPDSPRSDADYARIVDGIAEPFQGAIVIVDQGCAYYGALVVSGPHAGRVVYLNLDGAVPFFVQNDDFLSWYERWLDELLWGHKHFWFGMDMPGNQDQLRAAAAEATSPRRRDALAAMFRLPQLNPETIAVIGARLDDSDSHVRKLALDLVARFFIRGFDSTVQAALDDAQGENRLAALLAMKALGADWQPSARRALRDPDPEVVMRTLKELSDAKAVKAEELLPLLDSPNASIVGATLRALQANPSASAVDVLLARPTDTPPDSIPTLLAHVRADVMNATQIDAAFARVFARWQADPTSMTTKGFGAFVGRCPQGLDALIAATKHPDDFARFDAANALGDLKPEFAKLPAVREALQALLSDQAMPRKPNISTAWSVGESAKRALAKIESLHPATHTH